MIDSDKKYIEFQDGQKVYYQNLISSIPLPEICKIIKNIPKEIKDAVDSLWATSIALVSIGFNRPDPVNKLWFYIYDEDIYAARVYSPSLKANSNVPKGCSSLQFEYYFSKFKPLPLEEDEIIEYTINSLKRMNIASKRDIICTDYRVAKYGNVVFEHAMVEKREIIKAYLQKNDIYPIGRFGEWDYLWSDQSLLSGKRVIDSLFSKLKSRKGR